jgi:hypothetical protein
MPMVQRLQAYERAVKDRPLKPKTQLSAPSVSRLDSPRQAAPATPNNSWYAPM